MRYLEGYRCRKCHDRTEAWVEDTQRDKIAPCQLCGGRRKRVPGGAGLGGRLQPPGTTINDPSGSSPLLMQRPRGGAGLRVGPGMTAYGVGNNFEGCGIVLEEGGANLNEANSWISGVPYAIENRDAKNNRINVSGIKHSPE